MRNLIKFVKFLIYARFYPVKWHFPEWEVPKAVMLKLLTPKSGCQKDNLILPVTESVGHFGQLKKPDKLVDRDSQIFDRQLAKINGPKWPVEGSQGGTPCPVI